MSIIKIVTSDEARHYDCCVHERKCTGNICMAWVETIKEIPSKDRSFDVEKIPSGYGHCGIVKG